MAQNHGRQTPFGTSPEEMEIASIDSLLRIFGIKWGYRPDGDRWIAVMQG